VPVTERVIFNGEAGTRWVNNTGKVRYQFVVSFINTCGACLQYHMAIGPRWPIKLHVGCRCHQFPIAPGDEAPHEFVDFRKVLAELPHAEQVAAIGASNYKLLKAGVVAWDEIVTQYRVRTLREVLAINKVSLKTALEAGIKEKWIKAAHEAVHTPEAELIRQHREELIEKIKARGVTHQQLVHEISRGLVGQATIVGSSGVQSMATLAAAIPRAAGLAEMLKGWKRKGGGEGEGPAGTPVKPKPKPKPKPPPGNQPVLPGRPIRERLEAWKEGDEHVKALLETDWVLPKDARKAREALDEYTDSLKPGDRRFKAVREKIKELDDRAKLTEGLMYDRANTVRKELAKRLKPVNPPTWTTDTSGAPLPGTREEISKGEEFVRGLVDAPGPGREIKIVYRAHDGSYRAHAGGSGVQIARSDQARTVAHEIGHCLEDQLPGIVAVEKEFLAGRAGSETPKRFKELFPDSNYEEHEQGVEDEFGRYFSVAESGGRFNKSAARYVGKSYPDRSEVLSMGLEALYVDPVGFAQKDPEYFKLIIGLLKGTLR
jgi:hypothetical protein